MLRLIVTAVLLFAALCVLADARTRYPGQWSNVPPEVAEWYRTQNVPGTNNSCCSTADGINADEERRPDPDGSVHYWTKFQACQLVDDDDNPKTCASVPVPWMRVPDNVVLRNFRPPPGVQLPMVWYYWENNQWKIRCYAPEPDA